MQWHYSLLPKGLIIAYNYFSRNGKIHSIDEAMIPLSSVEYSYGFGVYETIRVTGGKAHFIEEHCQRLMKSAAIIGLEHELHPQKLHEWSTQLISKVEAEACNLKILLIGGRTKEDAQLYILALNPLFPDRKLYKTGVHCITVEYEREYPHAKTLNMLPSYLAYRQAKQAGAYDALLINRQGNIVEGTRTNFFAIKDKTLYSPPESEILLGVTRDNVLKVARNHNFEVIEQGIPLADIAKYQGAFLTSTSSKIMPIRSINEHSWPEIPESLKELIAAFKD